MWGLCKAIRPKARAREQLLGTAFRLTLLRQHCRQPLSASALGKAITGTQFNYSGPNYAAVKATNDRAIASGLSGGYDGNEILTNKDKAIIGYDPNNPASSDAANAIAGSRYNGSLTGEITSDFLSTLKDYLELSDDTIQEMQYRLSQLTYGNF
jgi:hypothetical protein